MTDYAEQSTGRPGYWKVVAIVTGLLCSALLVQYTAAPYLTNDCQGQRVTLPHVYATHMDQTHQKEPEQQPHIVWEPHQLANVHQLLDQEVNAVGEKYANCSACGGSSTTALRLFQQHIRVNAVNGSLAQQLMLSHLQQAQLTVAVTGGSSSAPAPGWHGRFIDKLKPLLLPKVGLDSCRKMCGCVALASNQQIRQHRSCRQHRILQENV
jgi:hypothetical protein